MSLVIGTPAGSQFAVRQSTERDAKSDASASDNRCNHYLGPIMDGFNFAAL